jgi:hypothetical protein
LRIAVCAWSSIVSPSSASSGKMLMPIDAVT